MSVPARLATAARCLLGKSAVMGRYAAKPSKVPLIVTHVAKHTPKVIYVTCANILTLSVPALWIRTSRPCDHLGLYELSRSKWHCSLGRPQQNSCCGCEAICMHAASIQGRTCFLMRLTSPS